VRRAAATVLAGFPHPTDRPLDRRGGDAVSNRSAWLR
jgi:hypothetical protein